MRKHAEIQRALLIYQYILDGDYPSLQVLSDKLKDKYKKESFVGWSKRTVQRDFHIISELMHVTIKHSKYNDGYYIIKDEASKPDEFLGRLIESFDLYNALDTPTGVNDIVFLEKRGYTGTENMTPLIKAIKNLTPVCFQYLKYGESKPTERKIYPYALKECRARWYLLGTEKDQKYLKAFGLERISDIKITTEEFKKNPEINIDEKYEGLFGIVDKEELPVEDITISFNYRDGQYVKSLPIHRSQVPIEENPDKDEIIFTLCLKITEDLVLELLSRGKSLKVIEPQHLVEKICDIYQQGLERYKC